MEKVELNEDDVEIVIQPKVSDESKLMNNGMYFTDQCRRIDIVLVYQRANDNETFILKRESFLRTLYKEGLDIEVQDENGHIYMLDVEAHDEANDYHQWEAKIISQPSCENQCNLVFVKIHATWDTLCRYAEVMKIRKPMLNLGIEYDFNRKKFLQRLFEKFDFLKVFNIDETKLLPVSRGFTWPFSKSKEYLFDIPDEKSKFFTPAERSLIVNYILRRASFRRISGKHGNLANPDIDTLEAAISKKAQDIEMGVITGDTNSPACLQKLKDKEEEEEAEEGGANAEEKAKISMDFGIAKLISDGVFDTCYPLHEPLKGDVEDGEKPVAVQRDNLRNLLYKNWVSMNNVFRIQPLDHIRLYFGEKIGFYFAWLGYYTYWLLPISLLGIIVTVYNITNTFSDLVVNEICDSTNRTMCPLICTSRGCKFWMLSSACNRFRVIRIVDNGVTVLMAIITSIWACLFLEMWKRQQSRLAYHWCVHDMEYEDEPPRPEFVALIDKHYPTKVNPISGNQEPYLPFWKRRLPILFLTFSTVILSVALALGFLVGIILYKLVMGAIFRMMDNDMVSSMSNLFSAATGSMISLIIIITLTLVYSRVATYLTDLEHHRTQSQYDSSVTIKLYLLEFVNNYSSVFYIAFIQPYTQPIPGYKSHSIIKPKGCPAGGCLVELSMQLAFIMIGKQIISHIKEYTIPKICSRLKVYKLKQSGRKLSSSNLAKNADEENGDAKRDDEINLANNPEVEVEESETAKTTEPLGIQFTKGKMTVSQDDLQYVENSSGKGEKALKLVHRVEPELVRCFSDNILADPGPRPLFSEYLEMLIQFGFMTIFIPAFPLAPMLALLNNIFEIRGDALKFIKALKRPVAQRVNDIGVWISILSIVTRIAVKSNALLIAFATNYIERLIFKIGYSADGSLNGFVGFSMSFMSSKNFNLTNFGGLEARLNTNSTYCNYFGYRYAPWEQVYEPYSFSPEYWQILAAKVVFVYLFENFVVLVMSVISIVVPDIPDKLRISMKREAVLTNEIILKAELLRHKTENASKLVAFSFKKNAEQNKKKVKSAMRNKQKWKGGTKMANLLSKAPGKQSEDTKIEETTEEIC